MQNLDSKYTAEIYSRTGSLIAIFSDVMTDRKFKVIRNRAGNASWNVDMDTLEQIASDINVHPRSVIGAGQNEIRIRRNDRYLWSGRIMDYKSKLSAKERSTAIQAVDWFWLLSKRVTGVLSEHSSIDAGAIAWDEINTTQQKTYGDLGITQGTIQTTQSRDRTYERKNIRELIEELTEIINGFDFEITWDKVFNVYSQIGVKRQNVFFEYPGNIKELEIETSALKIANKIYATGQGFGDGQLESSYEDTSTQAVYGLNEDVENYPSVTETTTLTQHAQEEVTLRKAPTQIIEAIVDGNVEPTIGSYWIGDRVKVRVKDHPLYDNINAYYQVDEIEVKVDEDDSETIKLVLSTNTAEE